MHVEEFATWEAFRNWLGDYFGLPSQRRRQLIFRGHGNAKWRLESTLDRWRKFPDDSLRRDVYERLLQEFRRELLKLDSGDSWRFDDLAFEFIARHHGLPTPFLDWTESPLIAAYFALADVDPSASAVAIWMLDRAKLPEPSDAVKIIDEFELLAYNRRAIRQRAVFLRVESVAEPLETMLSAALSRFELPMSEASAAMTELDEMSISGTMLFNSMDAAAKTVALRERLQGARHV